MIDQWKLCVRLGFNYDPFSRSEALAILIQHISDDKRQDFSYETLSDEWGWNESAVRDFLIILQDKKVIILENYEHGVKIVYGEGIVEKPCSKSEALEWLVNDLKEKEYSGGLGRFAYHWNWDSRQVKEFVEKLAEIGVLKVKNTKQGIVTISHVEQGGRK